MAKGEIVRTPNGAEFTMDMASIKQARSKGRVISGGGNVLVMEVGQTTGPWEIVEVKRDVVLDKKYGGTDVYIGECKGQRFSMPASTSFVEKAKSAGIDVGAVIAVTREADYRARGKDCHGYSIIVMKETPKK